jgi:phosphatidylglycerophosphate synthase
MEHPQQRITHTNKFVVDLLTTLREDKYSLMAWQRFLVRSWRMSCETANIYLSLKRSWWRVTMLMGVLTLGLCMLTFIFEGTGTTLRLLPGLLFCVVYQQSDLFWHLGLNRNTQTGQVFEHVGLANILTGLRGLCASYLLGRLIGGLHTSTLLALSFFVAGIVTDILDGLAARTTKTQSKLGQIADGEADFCLYGAISIILVQNALLPVWLGIIMIARFFLPLIGALVSYFLFAHALRFGSTCWGKLAGLSQCLYFLTLLAPPLFFPLTHLIASPLLIITLIFLLIAPIAQVMANIPIS